MNTVKPFYESRKKVYDCHVWWHPNFPFHLHKHMEFVHVTEGEMDATVAGVNYHLITGDCLMIYPNQIHSYSSVGEVGMLLIIADMDSIGEFQEELLVARKLFSDQSFHLKRPYRQKSSPLFLLYINYLFESGQ